MKRYKTLQFIVFAALFSNSPPLRADKLADVLRTYTIIGDFEQYPSLIEVNQNLFWTYPFLSNTNFLPYASFTFEIEKTDIPPTIGSGLLVQHLNRGRDYFLNGDYNSAAKIWRSATLNFNKADPYFKRLSFFAALSYIKIVNQIDKTRLSYDNILNIAAAASLLSDALGEQGDNFDTLIDKVSPKYFYYLSCLYYLGDDLGKATLAAQRGIDAIGHNGSSHYRSELRFLLAETYRANRDYLLSAQQLDAVIREELNLETSVRAFEKIGDLYFSLNNFVLAQDFYLKAVNLDAPQYASNLLPAKLAETKFWMKDFDASRNYLAEILRDKTIDPYTRSWMRLRLADIDLASNEDNAKFSYFNLMQTLMNGPAKKIAKIRQLCLDIPSLKVGSKTVEYASNTLRANSDLKHFGKSNEQTLATGCYIASLLKKQDHKEFIQRLNAFQLAKPESLFLPMIAAMGKKIQSERLTQLLGARMYDEAIKHYEVYKDILYVNLPATVAKDLFKAYVFHGEYEKARNFYTPSKSPSPESLAEMDYIFATNKDFDGTTVKRLSNLSGAVTKVSRSDLAYLRRILQANKKGFHFDWVLKTFQFNLLETEQCQFLSYQAPVSAKLPPESLSQTASLFSKVIDSLHDFQRVQPGCMEELANAEFLLYENQASLLSAIYLSRPTGWWFIPHISELAWQVSEKMSAAEVDKRLHILKKIAATGNPQALVVKYAKNQIQSSKPIAH